MDALLAGRGTVMGKSPSSWRGDCRYYENGPSLSNQAVHDQKTGLEKALTAQVLSSPKNIHAGLVYFSKKRQKTSQYDSVHLTAILQ
jgi:hypothetical protein